QMQNKQTNDTCKTVKQELEDISKTLTFLELSGSTMWYSAVAQP
ncbi:5939_t:CDS:1, partial [Funneliformis caledonium]